MDLSAAIGAVARDAVAAHAASAASAPVLYDAAACGIRQAVYNAVGGNPLVCSSSEAKLGGEGCCSSLVAAILLAHAYEDAASTIVASAAGRRRLVAPPPGAALPTSGSALLLTPAAAAAVEYAAQHCVAGSFDEPAASLRSLSRTVRSVGDFALRSGRAFVPQAVWAQHGARIQGLQLKREALTAFLAACRRFATLVTPRSAAPPETFAIEARVLAHAISNVAEQLRPFIAVQLAQQLASSSSASSSSAAGRAAPLRRSSSSAGQPPASAPGGRKSAADESDFVVVASETGESAASGASERAAVGGRRDSDGLPAAAEPPMTSPAAASSPGDPPLSPVQPVDLAARTVGITGRADGGLSGGFGGVLTSSQLAQRTVGISNYASSGSGTGAGSGSGSGSVGANGGAPATSTGGGAGAAGRAPTPAAASSASSAGVGSSTSGGGGAGAMVRSGLGSFFGGRSNSGAGSNSSSGGGSSGTSAFGRAFAGLQKQVTALAASVAVVPDAGSSGSSQAAHGSSSGTIGAPSQGRPAGAAPEPSAAGAAGSGAAGSASDAAGAGGLHSPASTIAASLGALGGSIGSALAATRLFGSAASAVTALSAEELVAHAALVARVADTAVDIWRWLDAAAMGLALERLLAAAATPAPAPTAAGAAGDGPAHADAATAAASITSLVASEAGREVLSFCRTSAGQMRLPGVRAAGLRFAAFVAGTLLPLLLADLEILAARATATAAVAGGGSV